MCIVHVHVLGWEETRVWVCGGQWEGVLVLLQ